MGSALELCGAGGREAGGSDFFFQAADAHGAAQGGETRSAICSEEQPWGLRVLLKVMLWFGLAIAATYVLFGGGILDYRICLNKPSIMTPMETFDMYADAVLKDIDLGRSLHRYTDRSRYRARVVQLMEIYRRDCLSKVFHSNCRVVIEQFGDLAWEPNPFELFFSFDKALSIGAWFNVGEAGFSEGFLAVPKGRACVFNGEWFTD